MRTRLTTQQSSDRTFSKSNVQRSSLKTRPFTLLEESNAAASGANPTLQARTDATWHRPIAPMPMFDPTGTTVPKSVQFKLTVGAPNDVYEQEADRMAEQVMSASAPTTQPSVQREVMEDVHTKPSLQRSADGSLQADSDLESRLYGSKGGGSPLPDEVRSQMEPQFGSDFSQVRVHTDNPAVQMNQDLNAEAFTHKQDIYFGSGRYNPGSSTGKQLLAHELTHVVQQTGGVQMLQRVDSSEDEEQKNTFDEQNSTPVEQTLVEQVQTPVEQTPVEPTPVEQTQAPVESTPVEQNQTPTDANLSTPEGTEVHVDAPSNASSDEQHELPPADVEVPIPGALAPSDRSDADAGAGGASGADQREGAAGAEGAANAPSEPANSDNHSEESWWDRGIDWAEGKVASGAHALADKAKGIPVVEQVADAGAFVAEQGSQYAGGLLKGAGTMVGGIGNMIANPVDTAVGLEAMAEHIPVMGAPLKAMHGIYDVAINDKDPLEVANHVLNPLQSLEDDATFYGNVAKGIAKPYQKEIEQGKYAEAVGRGVFDIGGIVLTAGAGAGAEGVATAGRGAAIAGEVADAAKVAEGAAVASDATKAAEVSDAANVADKGGDAGRVAEETANAAHNTAEFEKFKAQLAEKELEGAPVKGSALKPDPDHRAATWARDTVAEEGKHFSIKGGDGKTSNLSQVEGSMNGQDGIFEYIVDGEGNLTHQRFIPKGKPVGFPNQSPKKLDKWTREIYKKD